MGFRVFRYSEEELAAEPLLGVADWLNCAPSAVMAPAPGDLTSPAPKYHSQSKLSSPNFICLGSGDCPALLLLGVGFP